MSQSPLITVAALRDLRERNETMVILDTRAPEQYAAGHIPGAVNIHEIFTYLATSTAEGLAALESTFARLLGAAGIDGSERVVLYEAAMDSGYGQSCRGWFLLSYLGHSNVSILHGGLAAWNAEKLPLQTEATATTPKTFTPKLDQSLMLSWEQMLASLEHPEIVKLDVRDRDEWEGESSSPYGKDFAPRKGRIPGAVWLEWYEVMKRDGAVPWFKSPAEIRAMCADRGIKTDSKIYLYCFKGARASNTMVALREAGFRDVAMYFGSWNEWSRNPALPIEEGPPRK
jgi:thiosulfate/3-mercaptopyruvate sulfurtransferase